MKLAAIILLLSGVFVFSNVPAGHRQWSGADSSQLLPQNLDSSEAKEIATKLLPDVTLNNWKKLLEYSQALTNHIAEFVYTHESQVSQQSDWTQLVQNNPLLASTLMQQMNDLQQEPLPPYLQIQPHDCLEKIRNQSILFVDDSQETQTSYHFNLHTKKKSQDGPEGTFLHGTFNLTGQWSGKNLLLELMRYNETRVSTVVGKQLLLDHGFEIGEPVKFTLLPGKGYSLSSATTLKFTMADTDNMTAAAMRNLTCTGATFKVCGFLINAVAAGTPMNAAIWKQIHVFVHEYYSTGNQMRAYFATADLALTKEQPESCMQFAISKQTKIVSARLRGIFDGFGYPDSKVSCVV